MKTFDELWAISAKRKGEAALEERLAGIPRPTADEIAAIPDDRWLAGMAKRVFAAGFVWRVIDAKWEGFEEAFRGFDPPTVAHLSDDEIDALAEDTRIVRNRQKILATIRNAELVLDIAEEFGSFGQWIADWPDDDPVGLWEALNKRGSRLGGMTAALLLRHMGKDTFFLSGDVVARLIDEGVITKDPTSKRDKRAAQEALNTWAKQGGRTLAEVSVIAACSIDAPR